MSNVDLEFNLISDRINDYLNQLGLKPDEVDSIGRIPFVKFIKESREVVIHFLNDDQYATFYSDGPIVFDAAPTREEILNHLNQ